MITSFYVNIILASILICQIITEFSGIVRMYMVKLYHDRLLIF